MINIQTAHNFIRRILKKNYGGFVSPNDIDDAINAASLDLFIQQIKIIRETELIPDIMKNFKRSSNGSPSSNIFTISSEAAEITAVFTVVGGVEYPARIVKTEEEWVSRKLEDLDADPSNNLPLNYYLQSTTYTNTQINAGADLPADFIKEVSVSTVLSSGEYEGKIVSPDDFYSRKLLDLVHPQNREEEFDHLQKQEASFSLVAASNQFWDLPENFVKEIGIFYIDAQNVYHEGDVLTEHEWAERLDSVLLAPTVNDPIARIINNQIEFFPKPSGLDTYNYILVYKEYPTKTRAVFKIEDNQLQIRPQLSSGELVRFVFYQYPVDRRALIRVTGDNANNEVELEIRPTTVSEVTAYYLKKPDIGVFGYNSTNGVISYLSGSSTHLDWDYKAFSLLMTMALFYLGYPNKDEEVRSIPISRNQIEGTRNQL